MVITIQSNAYGFVRQSIKNLFSLKLKQEDEEKISRDVDCQVL